jgi:GTPase SAR1 family protein
MFIGDGEVGKTSLVEAFHSEDRKTNRKAKDQRTVGIDISSLEFASVNEDAAITCQVCDFAGQEIYYLSHTLHFTRRCLYVLMWTSHKFGANDTAELLDVKDIVGPLIRWLNLLANNIPDANVLVVGTHCNVDPSAFDRMRKDIDMHVNEEMLRLRDVTCRQAAATREVFERQQETVKTHLERINQHLASSHPHITALGPRADEVQQFIKKLSDGSIKFNPSLRRHATSLLESVVTFENTKRRLGRLHGVYDGSVPAVSASAARLKLVSESSFAVDSVAGVGVAELLSAIEATCRNRQALPFMGEMIPKSWLEVGTVLRQRQVSDALGDSVLSLRDAVVKLGAALRTAQPVEGLTFAQRLQDEQLSDCLEFWSLLGRVFIHDGHFMRDLYRII